MNTKKQIFITWAKILPLAMVIEALRYKVMKLWWDTTVFLIGSVLISIVFIIMIYYEDIMDGLRRK